MGLFIPKQTVWPRPAGFFWKRSDVSHTVGLPGQDEAQRSNMCAEKRKSARISLPVHLGGGKTHAQSFQMLPAAAGLLRFWSTSDLLRSLADPNAHISCLQQATGV